MSQPSTLYFSDKQQLRRPLGGLVVHTIPERVRNAVRTFVEERLGSHTTNFMWWHIVTELDLDPDLVVRDHRSSYFHENTKRLLRALERSDYGEWLDIASAMYYYLKKQREGDADDFRNMLNRSLLRHYSAYSMDDSGRMTQPGNEFAESVQEEARAILADPRMIGPDRQFQEAVADLRQRPNPNLEGAIAGAANALEGVAKIVTGQPNSTLGDAMKTVRQDKHLHASLVESLVKIYGYASAAGGRHGLVGDPNADQRIADFAVHQCAAGIVLLADLYGYRLARRA